MMTEIEFGHPIPTKGFVGNRINTLYNYIPDAPEENSGELVTQPDMALTASEVLARFQRGQTVPSAEGEYTDWDDYSKLSMEEVNEVVEDLKFRIDDMKAYQRNIFNEMQKHNDKLSYEKKLNIAKKQWQAEQAQKRPEDPAL